MTILPVELAEVLHAYIAQNAHIAPNIRLTYYHCIIISSIDLYKIFNYYDSVKINPHKYRIFRQNITSLNSLAAQLSARTLHHRHCRYSKIILHNYHKLMPEMIGDTIYVIKITNINPAVLTRMFENNACIYVTDVPGWYLD